MNRTSTDLGYKFMSSKPADAELVVLATPVYSIYRTDIEKFLAEQEVAGLSIGQGFEWSTKASTTYTADLLEQVELLMKSMADDVGNDFVPSVICVPVFIWIEVEDDFKWIYLEPNFKGSFPLVDHDQVAKTKETRMGTSLHSTLPT